MLLELDVFGDRRGRFMETYRRERYLELGVGVGLEFVQDNFSSSARGTLRGLHYQLAQAAGQARARRRAARCSTSPSTSGAARRRSASGSAQTLSADNHLQMWVPPGSRTAFS